MRVRVRKRKIRYRRWPDSRPTGREMREKEWKGKEKNVYSILTGKDYKQKTNQALQGFLMTLVPVAPKKNEGPS